MQIEDLIKEMDAVLAKFKTEGYDLNCELIIYKGDDEKGRWFSSDINNEMKEALA